MTSVDRDKAYGPPLANHQRIADLWSAFLGTPIRPDQVAICMVLVKVARLAVTPDHRDSHVDGAAYFAIAAEVQA